MEIDNAVSLSRVRSAADNAGSSLYVAFLAVFSDASNSKDDTIEFYCTMSCRSLL
jgi:hypothetical protein